MTPALRRRLEKLESSVRQQPTEHQKLAQYHHHFLMYAIAYHLGHPTPEESPAEAYWRALGYSNSLEFRMACDACDADYRERTSRADRELLTKFGVSREEDEWDAIVDAYMRMEAGFSEDYKMRFASVCPASKSRVVYAEGT
jgi:hypothetical protein